MEGRFWWNAGRSTVGHPEPTLDWLAPSLTQTMSREMEGRFWWNAGRSTVGHPEPTMDWLAPSLTQTMSREVKAVIREDGFG
ncbi:hypothetical protein J6590_040155 [Homalodisca vitripennis]|nr:hypothetical protein J6590_040155 [Homalodisca vitripennis]